jgi:hypothetical protein
MTTQTTHCLHDPLFKWNLNQLQSLRNEKVLGIADTGGWLKYDWIRSHPARKVGLIRPYSEINQSLGRMGFPSLSPADYRRSLAVLAGIPDLRICVWSEALGSADLFEWLTGTPHDEERTQALLRLNIQRNDFAHIRIEEDV